MRMVTGLGAGLVAWAAGLSALGAAPQAYPPLPASALPLELVGVLVDASEPARSTCLIRCTYPVARVEILETGETACGLAAVKEVRPDTVVITNLLTNQPEVLAFKGSTPATGASRAAAVLPPAASAPSAPGSQDPPAPRLVRTSPTVLTVELPEDAVRHYLANLPEFLDAAQASPRYRQSGSGPRTIEGFEIDKIKPAGVVEQMGLKNGDVILELNGQPLDSLASVLRLFGQAQGMPQSKMTVLRDGERLTFVFNRK